MTARGHAAPLVRAARVVLGAVLMACLLLPLAPQRASACDVSYGYKPSLSLGKPNLGRSKPCSTGTSLAGATIVAILTLGALAAAGIAAFRKGEATAGTLAHESGPTQVLATYLRSAALAVPVHHAPDSGEGGGRGANGTP